MKRRVLFVDDEPNVLQGLGRMLRAMRREWDMKFATSGAAALVAMEQEPFDLVVSDLQMPVMDGLQFLSEVRVLYPETIRMILSGDADRDLIMNSTGVTHQYLAKPCESETLKNTIRRSLELRFLLGNARLQRTVGQMGSLPSKPSLYLELEKELRSSETSMQNVGKIIAGDPSMTAKILKLVNSAFFASSKTVWNPVDAAVRLGAETLKALVLSVHAFGSLSEDLVRMEGFSIDQLSEHSTRIGWLAKKIMFSETHDKDQADRALTAGLLHDIGRLIFATRMPEQYQRALQQTDEGTSLVDAEKQLLGANHAEVGAYLLGLWGLPPSVVKAVCFHHNPGKVPDRSVDELAALHGAETLDNEICGKEAEYDRRYIEEIGWANRLELWRDRYQSVLVG